MTKSSHPDLSGVAGTMLTTLAVRAQESLRPDALVKDERAVALVAQLSRDAGPSRLMPIADIDKLIFILRSRDFDRCTRDFLARHPEAVVVHIGCGLDTRFERVDNGQVQWYDLDLSEVIELRRKYVGADGERYHLLGCSALDAAWLDMVSVGRPRPCLFLAEGVFAYFEAAQVRTLALALRDRFPGAELVFDALSPFHVWGSNLNLTIARRAYRFHWGLGSAQEVEGWGEGIRLLDDWGFFDRPEPRLGRMRWLRHIGLLARAQRIYRFQLGQAAG